MKTVVKIILSLAAFAGLVIALVLYATRGPVSAAEDFFAAAARNDLPAARALLSKQFLADTRPDRLDAFFASDLGRVTGTSWHSRAVENGIGRLQGSVTTRDGGEVPLAITLVKEDGAWRIQHIERRAPAGLSAAPTLPEITTRIGLVNRSTGDFITSVKAGDMTHFRSTVSELWRSQHDVARLNEAFAAFFGLQVDWDAALAGIEPELDPSASIDSDGVLHLAGHYPTAPNVLRFEHKYIREGDDWRLIGFNLHIE